MGRNQSNNKAISMNIENIEQFIASRELKFAIITKESWEQDEVANSLSSSPRFLKFNNQDMVILSLPNAKVRTLYDYVNGNVEFNSITLGSGKVTLLLTNQVMDILKENEPDEHEV